MDISSDLLSTVDAAIPFSEELMLHLGDPVWDMALRCTFKIDPCCTH